MLKSIAFKFILLLGLVSLFGDITYEGGRSIIGAYLSTLEVSAFNVGLIIGIAEILGYALRGLFGYLSDKTKKPWVFTIVGYIINLGAIPLLATTNSFIIASFFIILERVGKSIRVPARDAMLSYATKQVGRGVGFGIHEALDQIGAIIGPLGIMVLLFFKESYKAGFAALGIPAFISIVILIITRFTYPNPEKLEREKPTLSKLDKRFWIYITGISFFAIGFINYTLISFHFEKIQITPIWIPFFYSIAMAVDGISALIMGKLFDIKGIKILAFVTLITMIFSPFLFLGKFYPILFGMILWGISFGAQESIMRSVIPTIVSSEKRASAYGILNLFFGLFLSIGSAIQGFLYDFSIIYLVIFSIAFQFISIPFFLSLNKKKL